MPSSGDGLDITERMLLESLTVIDSCRRYNYWLASNFLPYLRGDVIEIGSGIGTLAQYYDLSLVRSALLTDISAPMLNRLAKRFDGNSKCRISELDILKPSGLPEELRGKFDCLICLNVLEHLADDREALTRMMALLRPGGQLLLLVPALPFLYGAIDQAAGHFRRYKKRDMVQLCSQVGFVARRSYYMNFLGIVSWFITSCLLRKKNISSVGCRMLDPLVPVFRFLESGIKPPLGQSLVYIGQKPGV